MKMEILLPGGELAAIAGLFLLILTGAFVAHQKRIQVRIHTTPSAPPPVSTAPSVNRARARLKRISPKRKPTISSDRVTRQPPLPLHHNPYTPPEDRPVLERRIMPWEQGKIATR